MSDDPLSVDQKELKKEIEGSSVDDKDEIGRALADLIDRLGDDAAYKMFSETTMEEVRHLSVELTVGDDITEKFAEYYLLLKISHGRAGREELLRIADALGTVAREEESSSIQDRLRGLI